MEIIIKEDTRQNWLLWVVIRAGKAWGPEIKRCDRLRKIRSERVIGQSGARKIKATTRTGIDGVEGC